jgi:hypothetical protein
MPAERATRRLVVTGIIAAIGVALVVGGLAANARWLDEHFLPSFFLPRRWYIVIHAVVRWTIVALGVWLAARARAVARRLTTRTASRVLPIAVAAILALAASEVVLERVHLRPAGWLRSDEEPRRQADARLGWTLVPARVGQYRVGRRTIDYAIDASGCRVRALDAPVDLEQPASR